MKRVLFFLLGIVFILFFYSACQSKPAAKPLRVGMDLSYPPFEMINEHGEADGISVAMAKALSDYLHRPLEIENIPFVGLLPSLQSNKIDLIISSMTDTEERRQSVIFSDPYVSIGLGVLTPFPSNIKTIGDLNHSGVTVAVRQGTTGQLWAEQNLKYATILTFDTEAAAVLEVLQKKVDAFLYDEMSVWRHHHEHPNETAMLLTPLQKESWGIAMRPSDSELCRQVNQFLKKFREEKDFEKLSDRYLKGQKKIFQQ